MANEPDGNLKTVWQQQQEEKFYMSIDLMQFKHNQLLRRMRADSAAGAAIGLAIAAGCAVLAAREPGIALRAVCLWWVGWGLYFAYRSWREERPGTPHSVSGLDYYREALRRRRDALKRRGILAVAIPCICATAAAVLIHPFRLESLLKSAPFLLALLAWIAILILRTAREKRETEAELRALQAPAD